MRLILFFLTVVMSSSPALASTEHSTGQRSYVLHVPDNLGDDDVSLILVLHGGLGNARYIEKQTNLNTIADRYGFIVAYPQGNEEGKFLLKNKRTWNAGVCCGRSARENIDDVSYLNHVISDIKEQQPIDAVYLLGHSNGAMMAYHFVCRQSKTDITGVIALSGVLMLNRCEHADGVKIWHIHGKSDQNVPYLGGVGAKSITKIHYPSVERTLETMQESGAEVVEIPLGAEHHWSSMDNGMQQKKGYSIAEFFARKVLKSKP